jgi:hypothetical protein
MAATSDPSFDTLLICRERVSHALDVRCSLCVSRFASGGVVRCVAAEHAGHHHR